LNHVGKGFAERWAVAIALFCEGWGQQRQLVRFIMRRYRQGRCWGGHGSAVGLSSKCVDSFRFLGFKLSILAKSSSFFVVGAAASVANGLSIDGDVADTIIFDLLATSRSSEVYGLCGAALSDTTRLTQDIVVFELTLFCRPQALPG
jgi:hypothetical protein